jgi:hypothetical protein
MKTEVAVLTVTWVVFLSNTAPAQAPEKDASPGSSSTPDIRLTDRIGIGDMLKAATELRKAAEIFERLGDTVEAITSRIAEAAVESSGNLAAMSRTFDPFGFKSAFLTIRQQGEAIQDLHKTIQDLQQAEIKRLKEQCRKLKKKLSRRERRRVRRR